ncbi:MAG: MlaC/ttg2D family ABC transporter substrate-binding protein [Nitrospinaceae bacterium]|jgi:phospholipid transport system substrate-binding protein|tara:strand:- start:659 stop:1291 length:633 start_codon:yes stop_codon:yes gene_type:complete
MKLTNFPVLFFVIGLSINLMTASVCLAGSDATSQLKNTIDEVIKIAKKDSMESSKGDRRIAMQKAIDERFNYSQMVRRSLGKTYDSLSDQKKQNFIKLFKGLLENSYASKLESYRDEKINFLDEVVKGKYALVKTNIVRSNNTIRVDYKLILGNGQWKVYDFVIEGVSMIRNYKAQFTKIIRRDSYEVLVEKLTKKINELEKGSKATGNL